MMECCGKGQRDSVSAEDVDRWTTNLSTLLASRRGRMIFHKFLQEEKRKFEEGDKMLTSWEHHNTLLNKQR
jgi:hypothetical protein